MYQLTLGSITDFRTNVTATVSETSFENPPEDAPVHPVKSRSGDIKCRWMHWERERERKREREREKERERERERLVVRLDWVKRNKKRKKEWMKQIEYCTRFANEASLLFASLPDSVISCVQTVYFLPAFARSANAASLNSPSFPSNSNSLVEWINSSVSSFQLWKATLLVNLSAFLSLSLLPSYIYSCLALGLNMFKVASVPVESKT